MDIFFTSKPQSKYLFDCDQRPSFYQVICPKKNKDFLLITCLSFRSLITGNVIYILNEIYRNQILKFRTSMIGIAII